MLKYIKYFVFGLPIFTIIVIYIWCNTEDIRKDFKLQYRTDRDDLDVLVSSQSSSPPELNGVGQSYPDITGSRDEKPNRPHIIFILADDLGWSDVGFHGHQVQTPFIDQLANSGLKLGNYYAQPNCSPSRASFLTGKYSDRNGVQHAFREGQAACLPLYHTTLPEALKQNGYSTHLIGKWHLGYCRQECLPQNRGFDSFFGMLGGSSDLFSHISKGRYDLWDQDKKATEYKNVYSAEIYGDKAVELIDQYPRNKTEKPMFLFLSFQVPHEPQQAPRGYIDKWKSYADVKPPRRQKLFGQISCMDEMIQKVVLSLKKNQLWNNSVLIFSSDNGGPFRNEASNVPLRGQKRTHFEGGIRVVGFVNSPLLSDRVKGTTFNGLMGIADWFPTFVEGLAGGETNRTEIDGINVWDSIRHGAPSPREDYVISVGEECLGVPIRNNTKYWDTIGIDPRTSIRSGPWKLIVQQDDEAPSTQPADVLLFNVDDDVSESINVAEDHPDIVTKLRQRVREYCNKRVPIVSFKTRTIPKKENDQQGGCRLEEKFVRRGQQ